jgi:hypothetical protein
MAGLFLIHLPIAPNANAAGNKTTYSVQTTAIIIAKKFSSQAFI